ncbi:Uncharacterized conserved protein YbcV, DUF1398 family [Sphingopyxis flava]|uniref:Uncharacterized conserved protein YbcV, DUF1398 family n=2 Tax=Sphingopyxis flava TaxID=1507287 RepID=A0A1T5EJF3_9SPHN|nr:Uncharacterized conserved protein YbcV, DUF1398 family [Sphingopyxis flava]
MIAIHLTHGDATMNEQQKATAGTCLAAADGNTMTFPQIVGTLMEAGFESYAIDFRRATATYYLPDGESLELPAHRVDAPVAPAFDTARMQAAIREAQQQVPGYTYRGFCEKAALSGCAGYIVSFSGRRALYIGRTAEIHVERFPNQ